MQEKKASQQAKTEWCISQEHCPYEVYLQRLKKYSPDSSNLFKCCQLRRHPLSAGPGAQPVVMVAMTAGIELKLTKRCRATWVPQDTW